MNDDLERFADLLANLIAKYIGQIDLDSLPDPPPRPTHKKPVTDDDVTGLVRFKVHFSDILSSVMKKNNIYKHDTCSKLKRNGVC